MQLEGIHHVTAITGDAPRNVEFYVGMLGLRMVKNTVNQDDPTVYHLFYADEEGSPGRGPDVLRVPRARDRAAPATGWSTGGLARRLARGDRLLGAAAGDRGRRRRARRRPAALRRPRGAAPRARGLRRPERPLVSAAPDVPAEHALQGFAAVRAYASDPEASADLLAGPWASSASATALAGGRRGALGGAALRRAARRAGRARLSGAGHGPPRRLRHPGGGPGRLAGARRAVRAPPDPRHRPLLVPLGLLPRALAACSSSSPPLGPGFATDEDPAHLGERLVLPPAFEHLRERVEQVLTPLPDPRAERAGATRA